MPAAGHLHRHRLLLLAMAQQDGARGAAVQAPAVARRQGESRSGAAAAASRASAASRSSSASAASSQASSGTAALAGNRLACSRSISAGVEVGVGEGRAGHQPRQEVDVVGHADHAVLRQRLEHARQRLRRSLVPDDQLGDHRVVVRRDRVALLDAGVDAHMLRDSAGGARCTQPCRSRAGSPCRGPRRRCAPRWRGRGSPAAPGASGSGSPAATRSCHSTRSSPVIISVTGCSTCSRVFISMK